MKNYQQDKTQQGQQGSGSGENTGAERAAQKNRNIEQNDAESYGEELSNDSQRMVNLRDMGSLSGRDDYAGRSGDAMEDESTGNATIR